MDRPKRLVKEASSWCEVLWGREPRNDQACWPRGRDKPTLEIRQLCTRLREVSRLEVVPQPCQWDSSCPWEAVHRNWQQLRWQSGWIDLRADELHSIHVTNDGCVLAELLQMILVESRGLVLMGLFELILLMASLSLSWTSSRMNLSLSCLLNKGEGGCDRPKSTEWTFFYIATLWNAFNNPWRLCLTDATSVARSVISQRLALRELLFLWSQRTENGRNFASNSYSHSSFWQTSRGSSTCTAIQSSEDTDPSGIQIDLTTLTLISRIWLLVIDAEVNGILVSALIDSGAQGSRLELQNDYTLLEERRRNLRSEFSARLEPSKTVLNHSPKPRSLIICIQW